MAAEATPTPDTTDPLTLRTLGDAGLYRGGAANPLLGPGKPFALVIYLALTPGRRISREFLLDLLWADLDPERARRALRQTLFHLRRLLGEETISGTEELTLHSAIDTDRDRFLAELEQGDLEAALTRYRGAFLPTFGVPGGAAFEHWADLERDRLQTAFLRSADILVRRLLNESRFKEGQRLARRTRDLVPQDEGAWRLVLETAIAGRDFVGAAVEAEALQRWAEGERISLESSTRTAIARAQGLTPDATDQSAEGGLIAELTGREREFFAITSAWEASRLGRSKHLHLSAPAGFGKSRLLRDACARLAAGGARVVRVQGTPGDRDVPYALAGDLASAVTSLPGATGVAPASAATLVALNPALSGLLTAAPDQAQGEEALRRRIHALVDLIHSVAHEQPFVLTIDDLHWIDQASYRVLEGVFGRLEGAHVLCLTAARPERQPLDDECIALPLPALTPEQLSNLVAALGALPERAAWSALFIAGLHEATGGSPLLVLETLRFAIDQGILALDQNEWRCLDEPRLHALLQAGEALRERVRTLSTAQGWLLGLLSTAGTALEVETLSLATASSPAEIASQLAPLEHQGLVIRSGAGWRVAHDEIAAASRAALTPELQVTADRTVGEYHARAAESDGDNLLRAARHFVAACDDMAVQRLYRQYTALARKRGDRRRHAELAAALVGEESSSPRVRTLVRSTPWSWRLGLWSAPRRAAALGLLLLLPTIAFMVAAAQRSADATLQRLHYADSTGTTTSLAARQSEWNATGAPLLPSRRNSMLAQAALGYAELPPAISPDGKSAAWIENSGDSTTLDIWLRTPSGVRRLTRQLRDDLVQGWLPDGSALIGTTNRWSSPVDGNYDVAVFDTATGAARQITRGPAQETNPYVSPDGTRVAFVRVSLNDPPMICVTTIDGVHEPDCRLIGGQPIASNWGWIGLDELLVTIDEPNARPLVIYDWRHDVRTVILAPYVYRARLSPDRRWVVASARVEGVSGFRDVVVPLEAPTKARQVADPGKTRASVRWWEGVADPSLLIDRLEFSDSVRNVLPGIGTRLIVRALSTVGTEIPMRVPASWSSSDTIVATVDSAGEVRVRSIGAVTVTASLAGWRTASKTLRVIGKPPVELLDETWDDSWTDRWLPWGNPRPVVTSGAHGIRGLWNHGDGTYPSMAVLRRGVPAKDGIGLEVRISSPLTGAQHQRLSVYLVAGVDIEALQNADQQKAPPSLANLESTCGIVFPGEGRWGATRIAVNGGVPGSMDLKSLAEKLRAGGWWTLRLQLLPDGRCGIAINGRVIWLSSEPIQLDDRFRIWLGDESAGVKLLHGPLQFWSGVRTDVSWGVPPPPSAPPSR